MAAAPEEACRPGTEADVPRLAELADAAVEELRPGRGGEVWARHAARRPRSSRGLARASSRAATTTCWPAPSTTS